VIGIVASISSVVTLLSILVVVHYLLRRRRTRQIHRTMQQKGIEGGPGFTNLGATPPPDPPSAQLSLNAITIINKPTPYPMEKYTSRPLSPYFGQSIPNAHTLDRHHQMQSLNAATADLDQILNASVSTPNDGNRVWSPSLSPSTPPSRDAQNMESSIRTKEQPKASIPASPLSSTSNFRDSIIPTGYIRAGKAEAESGVGDGRADNAARRSSTTVIFYAPNPMGRV
jgi:hypothetical protein